MSDLLFTSDSESMSSDAYSAEDTNSKAPFRGVIIILSILVTVVLGALAFGILAYYAAGSQKRGTSAPQNSIDPVLSNAHGQTTTYEPSSSQTSANGNAPLAAIGPAAAPAAIAEGTLSLAEPVAKSSLAKKICGGLLAGAAVCLTGVALAKGVSAIGGKATSTVTDVTVTPVPAQQPAAVLHATEPVAASDAAAAIDLVKQDVLQAPPPQPVELEPAVATEPNNEWSPASKVVGLVSAAAAAEGVLYEAAAGRTGLFKGGKKVFEELVIKTRPASASDRDVYDPRLFTGEPDLVMNLRRDAANPRVPAAVVNRPDGDSAASSASNLGAAETETPNSERPAIRQEDVDPLLRLFRKVVLEDIGDRTELDRLGGCGMVYAHCLHTFTEQQKKPDLHYKTVEFMGRQVVNNLRVRAKLKEDNPDFPELVSTKWQFCAKNLWGKPLCDDEVPEEFKRVVEIVGEKKHEQTGEAIRAEGLGG